MSTVIVRPGDTLSQLLKNAGNPNYNSPTEWAKYTNTPNLIRPGQQFNFPSPQMSSSSQMMSIPSSSFTPPQMSFPGYSSGPNQNMNSMNTMNSMNNMSNIRSNPNIFNLPFLKGSFQFPSFVSTAYAQEPSSSATLRPQGITPPPREVPMSSGGRTPVVAGTPSWVIPILQKVAQKHNVPTAILSAVAKHESGFDPTIRQPDGYGRGLFQLDIGQHPDVTEDEAFDPNFAADYAAKLLREGYDRTGSWEGALRYYNGGPAYNSNRPGYQGRPVSDLTMNYANRVKSYTQDTIPVEDLEFKKKMERSMGR